MSVNEEINKLKKLLEDGAITQDEFEHLHEQVLRTQNELSEYYDLANSEEHKFEKDSISNAHLKAAENNLKVSIIRGLKDFHVKLSKAGLNISSSVTSAVASQILLVIAFLVIVFGYIPISMQIATGSKTIDDAMAIIIIIVLLLLFSFISWVNQLIKLNRAGELMNSLIQFSYKEDGINIIPDRERKELKGLKIGQEFGGGILAFFDESKMFAVITAKNALNDKYTYDKAIDACKDFSTNDYNDWSLPSPSDLILIHKNLKENSSFKINGFFWCGDYSLVSTGGIGIVKDDDLRPKTKGLVRPIRIAMI